MAHSTSSGKRPATLGVVAILLITAFIGALWVPIYARATPKLGPFPFFYWYQFILVPVTAMLTWVCYLLLKTRHARDAGSEHGRGAQR